MPDLLLPVSFRSEILSRAVAILRSGESCALIGVGSSGKSNIARHLARADVRLRYFEGDAPRTIVLYLNCKPLAHQASHAFYLSALDQLVPMLEELDGDFEGVLPEVRSLQVEALAQPESLARRNLDQALGQSVRAGASQAVLILDDCDDLFAKADPILFTELRGLRDNYKTRLVYLTLTRREPVFLRADTPEYEELFELLSAEGHTIPVPPYLEVDGFFMLQRLAARQEPPRQLTDTEVRRLFEWGGGHAGLMRALFFASRPGDVALDARDALNQVLGHVDVESEALKIVDSLEPEEREDLLRVTRQEPPTDDGLHRLQQRGLVRVRVTGRVEIFSPVFEKFLLGQTGVNPAATAVAIEFVDSGHQVRINDELITTLFQPEYEILRRLVAARPEACSRLELVEAMREAEKGQGTPGARGDPLGRLDQYLHALKAKIGPAGHLIQPKGDGYALTA